MRVNLLRLSTRVVQLFLNGAKSVSSQMQKRSLVPFGCKIGSTALGASTGKSELNDSGLSKIFAHPPTTVKLSRGSSERSRRRHASPTEAILDPGYTQRAARCSHGHQH